MTQLLETDTLSPGQTIFYMVSARNMSISDVAEALDISTDAVFELFNDDRPITHTIAKTLETLFLLPASFWVQLQKEYDLKLNFPQ